MFGVCDLYIFKRTKWLSLAVSAIQIESIDNLTRTYKISREKNLLSQKSKVNSNQEILQMKCGSVCVVSKCSKIPFHVVKSQNNPQIWMILKIKLKMLLKGVLIFKL